MNDKTPIDILIEKGYDDVIVFCNPDYETALIGLSDKYQAVYDYDLMIEYLEKQHDMDYEEAADFIQYNDSFYYGEKYPVIYYGTFEEYAEDIEEDEKIVFIRLEDLPDKD